MKRAYLNTADSGFSRRVKIGIVSVIVVSLVIATWMALLGELPEDRVNAHPNTFSPGALGHQALVEFLRANGYRVIQGVYRPESMLGPGRALFVLEPSQEYQNQKMDYLRGRCLIRKSPLLLALPKWRGSPSGERTGWVRRVGRLSGDDFRNCMKSINLGEVREIQSSGAAQSVQSFGGVQHELNVRELRFLVADKRVEAVVGSSRNALIVRDRNYPLVHVLSDPDILNNQGLGKADHAFLVLDLLESLGVHTVVVDEVVHGFLDPPDFFQELFQFPMVLLVVHGGMLLGVLFWGVGARFGKPLPVAPALGTGKEVLIDNTAGLLAYGGHTPSCLAKYLSQNVQVVARYHGLTLEEGQEEMIVRLEEVGRMRNLVENLDDLRKQVEKVQHGRPRRDRMLGLAHRIHAWRKEMTDGS